MTDLDELLPGVLAGIAEQAPHDPALAARVRRQARRGRLVAGGVVAATVVAVASTSVAVAELHDRNAPLPAARPTTPAPTSPPAACGGVPVDGVLPAWATGGFNDPVPVMPFVRSTSGRIIAVIFADPLTAPPRRRVNNKILWVWQDPPPRPASHLEARLDGTDRVVTRGLPAPDGPSIVDLPVPGCWRLTITWPGGSDTIDLRYAPRTE